uniref:(California timema) hypothetical protein n=1 Tax=Timema californicum TaxID=61474 RepID=A0A7R9J9Q5_TIMCA|nr:unnamed protein product [Timema californicum]
MGGLCRVRNDCRNGPSTFQATCIRGECVCTFGFHSSADGWTCIQNILLDGPCSLDSDCFLTNNSRCMGGLCGCQVNFISSADNRRCLRCLGESCTNSRQCVVRGNVTDVTTCSNEVCECVQGYTPNNEKTDCIRFAPVSRTPLHSVSHCSRRSQLLAIPSLLRTYSMPSLHLSPRSSSWSIPPPVSLLQHCTATLPSSQPVLTISAASIFFNTNGSTQLLAVFNTVLLALSAVKLLSFESPSHLATPELLSQPDLEYLTRLASLEPQVAYARRHPKDMANQEQNMAAQLQILQDSITAMEERFRQKADRFGTTHQYAQTTGVGAPNLSTALPQQTFTAPSGGTAWASLDIVSMPTLVATQEQALRLALAAKAELLELQPGRDPHETQYLVGMMAKYPQLPARSQQKLPHWINMVFIVITKSWNKAILDTATAALYPLGFSASTTTTDNIPQSTTSVDPKRTKNREVEEMMAC